MALKSQKKSFVYKPRTADQVKARATKFTSNFDSVFKQGYDTFRPHDGDNLIRYLPATWDDFDHYCYTAYEHRYVGSKNSCYLCPKKMLNKRCPFCEAEKEALEAGEKDESKQLGAKERAIAWVLDRDADDPEKPRLWDNSRPEDSNIACLCINERTGDVLMIDHPDNGFDVSFKRKKGAGKLNIDYYGHQIDRHESPICQSERTQDEILDYIEKHPVPECLRFYDYDYLKGVLYGTVADKDEALDSVEEEPPFDTKARGPRRDQEAVEEEPVARPARSTRRPSLADLEDEAPTPVRSARSNKPEPVDDETNEEVDEDTGEVIETPRSRQTAPRTATTGRQRAIQAEVDEDLPAPARTQRTSVRR